MQMRVKVKHRSEVDGIVGAVIGPVSSAVRRTSYSTWPRGRSPRYPIGSSPTKVTQAKPSRGPRCERGAHPKGSPQATSGGLIVAVPPDPREERLDPYRGDARDKINPFIGGSRGRGSARAGRFEYCRNGYRHSQSDKCGTLSPRSEPCPGRPGTGCGAQRVRRHFARRLHRSALCRA